jgi:transcriptional regulator with XRE-family HTH domain
VEPAPTDLGQKLLGLRLREHRQARGLSLRQLSGRSGISPATLVYIEKGQRLASLVTLHVLAEAYGVTVRDLLKGVYPWDGGKPPTE